MIQCDVLLWNNWDKKLFLYRKLVEWLDKFQNNMEKWEDYDAAAFLFEKANHKKTQ